MSRRHVLPLPSLLSQQSCLRMHLARAPHSSPGTDGAESLVSRLCPPLNLNVFRKLSVQYWCVGAGVFPPPGSTPGGVSCDIKKVDKAIPAVTCTAAASSSSDKCIGLDWESWSIEGLPQAIKSLPASEAVRRIQSGRPPHASTRG